MKKIILSLLLLTAITSCQLQPKIEDRRPSQATSTGDNVGAEQEYYCGLITEVNGFSITRNMTFGGQVSFTPLAEFKNKGPIQYVVIAAGQIQRQQNYPIKKREHLKIPYSKDMTQLPSSISEESMELSRLQNLIGLALNQDQRIEPITCFSRYESTLYIGIGETIIDAAKNSKPIKLSSTKQKDNQSP